MEKNQYIGLLLIFAILFAWTLTQKPNEEIEVSKAKQSANQLNKTKIANFSDSDTLINIVDSVAIQKSVGRLGDWASSVNNPVKKIVIENEQLRLVFSTKGGKLIDAEVKSHFIDRIGRDHKKTKVPLHFLTNPQNEFGILLKGDKASISTNELIFIPEVTDKSIKFTLSTESGATIIQYYEFDASKKYGLKYYIETQGLNTQELGGQVRFVWKNFMDRLEINSQYEKQYSSIYFKPKEDESSYCSCTSDDEQKPAEKLEWVSHSGQFYNISLLSNDAELIDGIFAIKDLKPDTLYNKLTTAEFSIATSKSDNKWNFDLYVGPNDFNNLQSYNRSLEDIVPYGRSIFGAINRHVIRPIFNFLVSFMSMKGLAIIILILIIKILVYPLMFKSLKSQAKMEALKPEIDAMKKKYKDDQQAQQMETMKLYQEYGVSPLGGCLPMFLQMPIWYALFRFFPASITFRQEGFLWADDLSSYEALFYLPFNIPMYGEHVSLFTILWAISTVVYTYYNSKSMDMSANPAMKYVQYVMPLTFLVFFNSYASGLTVYMFFSNLFNIIQTIVTKNWILDKNSIRETILANKNKPKKKNKFQTKLEEALANQQKITDQRRNQKNK